MGSIPTSGTSFLTFIYKYLLGLDFYIGICYTGSMFKINNKNLISFTLALLTTFVFATFLLPEITKADFQPLNCEISSFNVSSNYISPGGSSTVNWNTNNCNSISISNIGTVSTSGSQVVYPMYTTTYVLTAYGQNGGSIYQSRTVTVQQLHCEIPNFNVSSSYINSGGSSTLNWNTNNCNSVSISNIGSVNSSGSQVVYPLVPTTYILTAYGQNGEAITKSRTVTVQGLNCEISSFNASSTYINRGDSSTLTWDTNSCNSMNISNIGTVSVSGSQVVHPINTTTYTLTGYSSNGTSVYQTKTIRVASAILGNTTSSSTTKNTSNTSKTTTTSSTSKNNTTNNQSGNENQTSDLAANALFGSGGFLPSSLFGWLFFAILVLIAVILWRKLYVSDRERQAPLKHA